MKLIACDSLRFVLMKNSLFLENIDFYDVIVN
jgi:hypothetical protein